MKVPSFLAPSEMRNEALKISSRALTSLSGFVSVSKSSSDLLEHAAEI